MAMGRRDGGRGEPMWIATTGIQSSPGHVFYETLNRVLADHGFDRFCEDLCRPFYADGVGRPSIPPGVYFRACLIGYFEGIESMRGIAWRCADSLALRSFLGITLDRPTPDHSTLSRTRRLLDDRTHEAVFDWVLRVLAEGGMVRGTSIGVDATNVEASAAMRSIVRRDTGEGYRPYLERLTRETLGVDEPTLTDVKKVDRTRKNKASNADWKSPTDPDARITHTANGRTRLCHKLEHAVDLDTGAVVGVSVYPADAGDSTTFGQTTLAAMESLDRLINDEAGAATRIDPARLRNLARVRQVRDVVTDRGGHAGQWLADLDEAGLRGYVAEPRRGRRRWKAKRDQQRAVYANRRRIRSRRGERLRRRRAELVERSFAHTLETGGGRRSCVHGRTEVLKLRLLGAAAHNLSLIMRRVFGVGTPRGMSRKAAALAAQAVLAMALVGAVLLAAAHLLIAACCRSRLAIVPRSGRAAHDGEASATAC